ncbi:MAG: site-specific DNA-methyltransferase [Hadesarchaea archaeon]|nr:MAG: site-specific DNA-methyltransferase [Hadesarchaea archaeon]
MPALPLPQNGELPSPLLSPMSFEVERTTVWSFPERGRWATQRYTSTYRGNFAPQIPRNLILLYSKPGEVVLDPFVGSGTTLIECKLLGRKGIGVDINPATVELCRRNLEFRVPNELPQVVKQGDARNLDFLENESVDLIIAHPPYANAIRYSEDLEGDLSRIHDIQKFLGEMGKVAQELHRVLKRGRCCSLLIGDLRRNKHVVPLGFHVFQVFLKRGFLPREIIIKVQHRCRGTEVWISRANDFLLLAHEYLFVFEKSGQP